jgi:endoglucanase
MRALRLTLAGMAMSLVLGSCASSSVAPSAGSRSALSAAANRFLSRYVTSDGRVRRWDQGGDIVSEGQAYGILIAESVHRPAIARTIWEWTSSHLRLSDGLFAWHATGSGQIENSQSATDADVLLAYGLLRYAGPGSSSLHAAGRRVAAAVLANESVTLADGGLVLVAGPWAKTSSPPVVDPSYLMPGIFAFLADATGDDRWRNASSTAISLVGSLTGDGHLLPSDWAQLSGASLVAVPATDGSAPVQYGLDAARVPIWFATSCESDARALAADWWRNVLDSNGRTGAIALSLDGGTIDSSTDPLPLLAAAFAASAAGATGAAAELRAKALALSLRTPTYYGDAWVALSAAMTSGALFSCKEVSHG